MTSILGPAVGAARRRTPAKRKARELAKYLRVERPDGDHAGTVYQNVYRAHFRGNVFDEVLYLGLQLRDVFLSNVLRLIREPDLGIRLDMSRRLHCILSSSRKPTQFPRLISGWRGVRLCLMARRTFLAGT